MEYKTFKDFPLKEVGVTIQLVGGVWADEGNLYFMHIPEFGIDDRLDHLDFNFVEMDDSAWKEMLRQSDLVEVEVLSKCENGKLYKAIVRKCTRTVEQGVSWRVFKRDGYACRYCGNDDVPLTVDHLVLWEEGGPSIEENLASACKRCNKTRGNFQYEDWLGHPYYLKVAENLTAEQRQANIDVADTLAGIPRLINVRKRK